MISRSVILFFILLASAQLSFGIEQNTSHNKMVTLSESQKRKLEQQQKQEEEHKLLVGTYDKLSDTIAADDIHAVEKLFQKHSKLKSYAHHNEGTPLHFARSLGMAQLLAEKIGFDANRCDEWGELPSTAILATKDQFFPNIQEKAAIAQYLTSYEKRFSKLYYQLKHNKNIHRNACAFGLATFLYALDCYLLAKLSHKLSWK